MTNWLNFNDVVLEDVSRIRIGNDDLYRTTGINKLTDRANSHLLKIMYKRSSNDVYLDLTEVRTRLHDGPVLYVPFPNNETFRKSIVFRGSRLWNTLTPDEREGSPRLTTSKQF